MLGDSLPDRSSEPTDYTINVQRRGTSSVIRCGRPGRRVAGRGGPADRATARHRSPELDSTSRETWELVRDSKDRSGPVLAFGPAAWRTFVRGVAPHR
ncbi:DUF397 domain-containing protein [Plantactinospora sp. B6F1]|uniref:DUF397 domain-containing protein n=1 Tax=Plantactinospora sp. B6F1 TaxID=3158971 RepID=UPI0032D9A2D4